MMRLNLCCVVQGLSHQFFSRTDRQAFIYDTVRCTDLHVRLIDSQKASSMTSSDLTVQKPLLHTGAKFEQTNGVRNL